MSAATTLASEAAASSVPAPPTLLGAYLARLRHKETRGGTALRTLFAVALGAGAVAAVRWQGERRYAAGYRDGQAGGYGSDGGLDP